MPARSGKAQLAAVVGDPIGHSLSPAIHEYWLSQHGIDGAYIPLRIGIASFSEQIAALKAFGFCGFNITLPHKQEMLPYVDQLTSAAKACGAVNTVYEKKGVWHGDNSDASGCMAHLLTSAKLSSLCDKNITIIGAGGAARGVAYGAIIQHTAKLHVINRTAARAEALVSAVQSYAKESVIEAYIMEDAAGILPDTDILIQTTSCGMEGQPPLDAAIDVALLPDHAVVYDIVYQPLITPLLKAAQGRGLTCVDGLGMLLHQAVPGFEAWFGVRPEVTPELRTYIEGLLPPCK